MRSSDSGIGGAHRMDVVAPICPKCGQRMRVIDYSSRTDGDVVVADAICENCLHVMPVTFLVVRKGEK